jgi:hypothetical protein
MPMTKNITNTKEKSHFYRLRQSSRRHSAKSTIRQLPALEHREDAVDAVFMDINLNKFLLRPEKEYADFTEKDRNTGILISIIGVIGSFRCFGVPDFEVSLSKH